jgi:hypothetical protein
MPPLPIRLRDPMLVGGAIGGVIAPRGLRPSAAPDPLLVAQSISAPSESLRTIAEGLTPTFRAAGTFASSNALSTISPGLPAGTLGGDLLLAQIVNYIGGGGDITTVPAGWTLLSGPQFWWVNGNAARVRIYFKIASGAFGQPTTESAPSWGQTLATTAAGHITAWLNVDQEFPIHKASAATIQQATTSFPGSAVVTEIDRCLIVTFLTSRQFSAGDNIVEPPGYIKAYVYDRDSFFSADYGCAYVALPAQGSSGTATWTAGSAGFNGDYNVNHIIALAPLRPARRMPIESLQKVVSTSSSPSEGGGSVAQTGSFPGESLQKLAATLLTPGESTQLLNVLATEPGEWLLRVLAPSPSFAGESGQGVASIDAMPAESLQALAKSSALPGESAAAVRASTVAPGEWLLRLAALGSPQPVEILQGLAAAAVKPGESAAGVTSLVSEPGESVGDVTALSGLLPGEWLTLARATSTLPGEALTGVAAAAGAPAEALAAVLVPLLLPAESLARVAAVAVEPGEAGSPLGGFDVSSVASFPIESLAGVGRVALLPGEFRTGGGVYRVALVALSAAAVAAADLEVRRVADVELEAAQLAAATLVAEPV